ncbi:MAG: extracellular solute-binding protein [Treponema sp.]|jgi:raffinose/stachyose/melibiose transport system substrate-binding protein|nr:extracellular solute-binding protein [Treponema sp.]
MSTIKESYMKEITMKKLAGVVAVLFFFTISVNLFAKGGGQQASSPGGISGTLTFWHQYNDADPSNLGATWMRENVRLFRERYPDVRLEITNISGSSNEYLTKITTEIAAGRTPDVFETYLTGRLEPYVTAGRVAPLNSLVESNPDLKRTISPKALALATFGNNYYAIPTVKSAELIYYNKKIFTDNGLQVPKSYDEFMRNCSVLKAKGITPVVCGNLDIWPGAMPYMMLFNRMNGNALYEEVVVGHKAKFDDPAFAETGKKLQEMFNAGVFNASINSMKYDEAQVEFTSGRAAMTFDGAWNIGLYYNRLGDDLGIFNFPMVPGGKGTANDWLVNYDTAFAISSNSRNRPAAEALMSLIFSPERMAAFTEMGMMAASVNLPVDTSKIRPIMLELSNGIDNANYGNIPWDNPLGSGMGNEFNLAVQRCYAGEDPVRVFQNLNNIVKVEWQ